MDLPNRPCLLAFCRRAPRFEEAFRAELRALGAPLFAFAPGSGTIFGADDEPRDIGPHPELWRIHGAGRAALTVVRSEEHTSELQSQSNLVCRLLLEKKKKRKWKL